MNVRAKLVCTAVTPMEGLPEGEVGKNVTFMAQYSDNKEDNSFSKWTPSASMSMAVTNPDLQEAFEQGKAYYIDFTPAN